MASFEKYRYWFCSESGKKIFFFENDIFLRSMGRFISKEAILPFLVFSRRVAKGASTMNTPLDSVLLPAENPATPFCRICLEEDGEMISPCQCTGTLAHVHEPCLRQWRDQFDPCDERALRCQQCTAPYHPVHTAEELHGPSPAPRQHDFVRSHCLVHRDHLL